MGTMGSSFGPCPISTDLLLHRGRTRRSQRTVASLGPTGAAARTSSISLSLIAMGSSGTAKQLRPWVAPGGRHLHKTWRDFVSAHSLRPASEHRSADYPLNATEPPSSFLSND